MATEELDLLDGVDALIRDMEKTAPQEEFDPTKPKCKNCDFDLEEDDDGNFICPNCQAQATDIQQLEDTEMFIGTTGFQLGGGTQIRKKPCGQDYGFAWSTDQAIFEILLGQLNALKEAKIVDDMFCRAVLNMWTCFWLKFIGPIIRDSYDDNELIVWDKAKYLKERDFHVLIAKDDKYFVPNFNSGGGKPSRVSYPSRFTKFVNPDREFKQNNRCFRHANNDDNNDISSNTNNNNDNDIDSDEADELFFQELRHNEKLVASVDDLIKAMREEKKQKLGGCATANTTILTLDRTLAFIEAAARALNMAKPIFASDIVRWCNYRLIPYFGAQNLLPDGINLNQHDVMMFSKKRSPQPEIITLFASRLLMSIYTDELPRILPRPDLSLLLQRLIKDMNLPFDLFTQIDNMINYDDLKPTKNRILKRGRVGLTHRIPQYDRWAFAILACHLKRLFNMDRTGIKRQHRLAQEKTQATGQRHFSFLNWSRQMCLRLKLVLKYDPYVLYHPITNVQNLRVTPALTKYIESLIDDRPTVAIHLDQARGEVDRNIRKDLAEFLNNEIPRPDCMLESSSFNDDIRNQGRHLRVRDLIHPLSDAYWRVKSFWKCKNELIKKLIDDDFSADKLDVDPQHLDWPIYADQQNQFRILESWPGCFKIIMELGAYLFFCEPEDLLYEFSAVHDVMFPEKRPFIIQTKTRQITGYKRAFARCSTIDSSSLNGSTMQDDNLMDFEDDTHQASNQKATISHYPI